MKSAGQPSVLTPAKRLEHVGHEYHEPGQYQHVDQAHAAEIEIIDHKGKGQRQARPDQKNLTGTQDKPTIDRIFIMPYI